MPELHVEAEQPAVVVEADPDLLELAALVRAGDEVLAPVLGPLHLLVEKPCRPRDQHLLRPRVVDLDAEAAAHVGRDALDLRQRQVELGRDGRAHAGRGLGRGVDPQLALVGVPAGQHALALHRHAGAALDVELELEGVRGCSDRRVDVADLLQHAAGDVAGHVVVHQGRAVAGVGDADDGGEQLVVDPDPLADVLGDVAVAGDHHDDGLADVVDLVPGQRELGAAVGQGRVRDEQRQRLADPAGEVLVGPDADQPVDLEGVGHVDVDDAGVRVRAAHEGGGQGGVPQVVEVAPTAGHQPRVLAPLDRRAEHLAGHGVASPVPLGHAARPSARRGARRRAGPTSRCSGSRCSGRGCRRSPRGPRRRWGAGGPRGRR